MDHYAFQHRLKEAYTEELSRLEARKWAELDQERLRAQEAVSRHYWLTVWSLFRDTAEYLDSACVFVCAGTTVQGGHPGRYDCCQEEGTTTPFTTQWPASSTAAAATAAWGRQQSADIQ